MSILSQFLSIFKLLKNDNLSQLRTGKNPITPLYSDTTKCEKIFDKKKTINNVKIIKLLHAYKGYASTYTVDILNSFNPELRLKDTESIIKNKLKDSLSELRGFKFLTTLVLEFKKIESDDATKCSTFYLNSRAQRIINESDIDYAFESIYSTIISNIQNLLEKVQAGLLIQPSITLSIFQSTTP